jgi:hypothetical protein
MPRAAIPASEGAPTGGSPESRAAAVHLRAQTKLWGWSFALGVLDRAGEGKQVIDLGGLQRVEQTLRGANDNESTAGMLPRHMRAYQAADTGRVDIGNVSYVHNQQVRLVTPHHRLKAEEIPQQ